MKVLILGGSGMLGNMMAKVLPGEWDVRMTGRWPVPPFDLVDRRWDRFEIDSDIPKWTERLRELMLDKDVIINCLGSTKPLLPEDEYLESAERAMLTNVVLPTQIASNLRGNQRAIHITTDCVFDGRQGHYAPHAQHDATDLYGISKSCGEVRHEAVMNLRVSIIGPEVRSARYLLGKVIEGKVPKGYTNHLWNGITTLALTKITTALIQGIDQHFYWTGSTPLPIWRNMAHIHAADRSNLCPVSKADLCRWIVDDFRRPFEIEDTEAPEASDMQLAGDDVYLDKLWQAAGYLDPPTVREMVTELAEFCAEEMWPQQDHGWMYWQRK
jgi:dTDP-4-dehydrorhamnose reductase